MKCKGHDPCSGRTIELEFDEVISSIATTPEGPSEGVYITPGFIDLQVNGCAGVDYNSPTVDAEDVGASIRALHSTGVTRVFPTVITGPAEAMLGALRNLAQAKEAHAS